MLLPRFPTAVTVGHNLSALAGLSKHSRADPAPRGQHEVTLGLTPFPIPRPRGRGPQSVGPAGPAAKQEASPAAAAQPTVILAEAGIQGRDGFAKFTLQVQHLV